MNLILIQSTNVQNQIQPIFYNGDTDQVQAILSSEASGQIFTKVNMKELYYWRTMDGLRTFLQSSRTIFVSQNVIAQLGAKDADWKFCD